MPWGQAECQFSADRRVIVSWLTVPVFIGLAFAAGRDYSGAGVTGMPRPGSTWAAGSAASTGPGSLSLDPRIPDPMTTEPVLATASSTSTGQSAGRPTGVIPPYSMPVAAVTASTEANDAFRASRCLRTSPLTSARVVAATMQAA